MTSASPRTGAIRGTAGNSSSANNNGNSIFPASTATANQSNGAIRNTASNSAPEFDRSQTVLAENESIRASQPTTASAAFQKKDNSDILAILPFILQIIKQLGSPNPTSSLQPASAAASGALNQRSASSSENSEAKNLNANFSAILRDPKVYKDFINAANIAGARINPNDAPSQANLDQAMTALSGKDGKPNAIAVLKDSLSSNGYKDISTETLAKDGGAVARAIEKENPSSPEPRSRSFDGEVSIE